MNPPVADEIVNLLKEAAAKIKLFYLCNIDANQVQEQAVTSSKPSVLDSALFGHRFFEFIKGFVFVVNANGRVLLVADNVDKYIGLKPLEFADQSIYDFIHKADHDTFNTVLSTLTEDKLPIENITEVKCRLKNLAKGKHANAYISMQIICIKDSVYSDKTDTSSSENQFYLICVAQSITDLSKSRISKKKSTSRQPQRPAPSSKSEMAIDTEYFLTQCDMSGCILMCDFSKLHTSVVSSYFLGQSLETFVHSNDLLLFQRHIENVKSSQESCECNSSIYRFKLNESRYVFVQSRSRLISTNLGNSSILSRHSIVRECITSELKGSASTSLMKSIIQSHNAGQSFRTNQLLTDQVCALDNQLYQNSFHSSHTPITLPSENRQQDQQTTLTSPLKNSGNLAGMNAVQNSGVPHMSDVNANELYSSSVMSMWGMFDNNNGWLPDSSVSQSQPLSVRSQSITSSSEKSAASFLLQDSALNMSPSAKLGEKSQRLMHGSYNQSLEPFSNLIDSTTNSFGAGSGKLAQMLLSSGDGMERRFEAVSNQRSPAESHEVLRTLLRADDNDVSFTLGDRISSDAIPKTNSAKGDATNTSSASSSISNSRPSEHHLLKKLLSEDGHIDDPEKLEKSGLLKKLLQDDEKEVSASRKSPSQSPSTPSSTSSRRHSSGGSCKEISTTTGKLGQTSWEKHPAEEGRGTKRKANPYSVSSTAASSSVCSSEADSTAGNTILSQLLTKPYETNAKPDPSKITASPFEKKRFSISSGNILDIVDNKPMHPQEMFNMDRFAMVNNMKSQPARIDMFNPRLSRPNSSSNNIYQGSVMEITSTAQSEFYVNNNVYHCGNSEPHRASVMNSYQVINDGLDESSYANGLSVADNLSSNTSLLNMLSNDYIKDLELLLGSSSPSLTSPEDEMAIWDIEQQLLSIESLPKIDLAPLPNVPSPLSGMTNLPAVASNPSHSTALVTISHKPSSTQTQTLGTYTQSTSSPPMSNDMMAQFQSPVLQDNRPRFRLPQQPSPAPQIRQPPSSPSSGIRAQRASGSNPSRILPVSVSSAQPTQNAYLPKNFGELMKSDPPPNMELPQELVNMGYTSRNAPMLQADVSAKGSRLSVSGFAQTPMDISTSTHFSPPQDSPVGQYTSQPMAQSMGQRGIQRQASVNQSSFMNDQYAMNMKQSMNQPSPSASMNTVQTLRHPMDTSTSAPSNGQYQLPFPYMGQLSSRPNLTSQNVRDDLRAKVIERASSHMYLDRQHSQSGMMNSGTQSFMSNPPPYSSSMSVDDKSYEIPDDIFNQITELADKQKEEERNKQHMFQSLNKNQSNSANSSISVTTVNADQDLITNRINQSKKEATEVKEQLRALADNGSQSISTNSTLDKVLFNQLSRSSSNTDSSVTVTSIKSYKTSMSQLDLDKSKNLIRASNISIIQATDRPAVQDLQPTEPRNSLLQQLLTE